jgi:hypothetical protein
LFALVTKHKKDFSHMSNYERRTASFDRVASPQEFVTETRSILAYAQTEQPSRGKLAHALRTLADRVAGRLFVASHTPLYGHTDENSAYVVDDYPYGFRLRTKIRYWLEKSPSKGYRFVSQTLNPKTQKWNAPKKSTYAELAGAMYLDEKGHVQWDNVNVYTKASHVLDFVRKFPRADLSTLKIWAKKKFKFYMDLVEGKAYFTMNGVRQKPTEEDIGEANDQAEQWFEVSTYIK